MKTAFRRYLLASLLSLTAGGAWATEFHIVPGESPTEVKFFSKAKLESFDGKTSQIEGIVVLNPEDVGDSISVTIEIDMASLDTGIGLRNKHMRKNHLDTDEFPKATFIGVTILNPVPSQLDPGKTVTYVVMGTLEIHGRPRRRQISIDVTYTNDDGVERIHMVSEFSVSLQDHEIKRPKFLFLKLNEVQQVRFEAIAEAR
jgi:polyisoprenoid-binding protein YceI